MIMIFDNCCDDDDDDDYWTMMTSLFIHVSINLSIYTCIHLSIHQSIHSSIHQFIPHPSIYYFSFHPYHPFCSHSLFPVMYDPYYHPWTIKCSCDGSSYMGIHSNQVSTIEGSYQYHHLPIIANTGSITKGSTRSRSSSQQTWSSSVNWHCCWCSFNWHVRYVSVLSIETLPQQWFVSTSHLDCCH